MRTTTAVLLVLGSVAWGEQRYRMSTTADGTVTLKPLAAEDVTGDGKVDRADLLAVQAAIPASTQVAIPAPPPEATSRPALSSLPTTPVNCTVTVSPKDNWQTAVNRARPGDTICFAGGDYQDKQPPDKVMLYSACLAINVSGEPDKPITFRNVPGERPVFWGSHPLLWAIRIGYVKYNGDRTGVHDVIVDGLHATQAPWDGIEISHSARVVVRNCYSYANNFNSPNGYKAGINIDAGHDIIIDHCRIFDNGFGICGYEDQPDGHEWPNPSGPFNVTLSNNFIFANSRSGNLGNSPGMDIRFATRCTYEGNIFYDNPDAGINGEGNNFCRVLRNICINNWQPGGNNEGGKICVRGGGGNVVAFNLFVNNGNCGWDATSGVGDVLVNNTCYGNGSWGVLVEGWETMMFNNILAGNSVRVTDNAYPEMAATGWSLISDWNIFGRGPLTSTTGDTLAKLPPHTRIQSVSLPGLTMKRTDVRQVIPPEIAFGVSTIEEARAVIIAKYKPSSAIPGDSLADIQARCNGNIAAVKAACDAAIAKAASSPDFQMKQATFRWQTLKAELTGYDLSSLKDAGGNPIGAAPSGAVQ